jgi:hypothetical protein
MKELEIDMAELAFAFEDNSTGSTYYLDLDIGSIIMVRPDLDDVGEIREAIELEPDRYAYIPKPNDNQLELDLTDFAATLTDTKIKSMIELAMESPNKYASVRAVLQKADGEWERWEEWKKQSGRQRALRWLEANEIKAIKSPAQ